MFFAIYVSEWACYQSPDPICGALTVTAVDQNSNDVSSYFSFDPVTFKLTMKINDKCCCGAKLEIEEKNAPLASAICAEDVGNSALFLLSSKARAITGQVIHVDAGLSLMGVFPES